jgi:hypothetical protein
MKRFFAPGSERLVKMRSSVMPSSWICVRQPKLPCTVSLRAHQVRSDGCIAECPGSRLEEHVAARHLHALAVEPAANLLAAFIERDLAVRELSARKEGAREAGDAPTEHRNALWMRRRGRRVAQLGHAGALRRQQRAQGPGSHGRLEERHMSSDKHCRRCGAVAGANGGSMAAHVRCSST